MRPRHLPDLVRTRDLALLPSEDRAAADPMVRVRRGVLAPATLVAPGAPRSPAERAGDDVLRHARAFERVAGTPFAFSRTTAAILLGCWVLRPGLPVHVTQETRASTSAHDRRLVVRHRQRIPERDLRVHDDVVVTSLERTVVECAATLPFTGAVVLADSGLRLGADRAVIEDLLGSLAGSRGIRQARAAIEAASNVVHSPGESMVRAVALRAGLPAPTPLHVVDTDLGPQELDVAWVHERVAVEMDGAVKLAGLGESDLTRRLHAEMERHDALTRAGWVILRATWAMVLREADLARRLVRLVHHRML